MNLHEATPSRAKFVASAAIGNSTALQIADDEPSPKRQRTNDAHYTTTTHVSAAAAAESSRGNPLFDPELRTHEQKRVKRNGQKHTHVQDSAPEHKRMTVKMPDWNYIQVRITLYPADRTSSRITLPSSLDDLTLYQIITAGMTRYLGVVGSAIPFDLLHTDGLDVILRVPYKDYAATWAALSAYTMQTASPGSSGSGGPRPGALVHGCAEIHVAVLRASRFLNGIVRPERGWTPPKPKSPLP
ncbi:uncharacterized protein V1518DRAFT_411046 [Limtongia smithiae]|uniref:uncharacterized protein n=1 Tax=Limtongia smithiae TaxID=1125753 RepID=UPI0034CF3FD4